MAASRLRCWECGTAFYGRVDARYCCGGCRQKAHRARGAQRAAVETVFRKPKMRNAVAEARQTVVKARQLRQQARAARDQAGVVRLSAAETCTKTKTPRKSGRSPR
jgi:hypothetical protein